MHSDNIQPEIKIIPAKKLVGLSMDMSLVDDKTFQLFSTFMPRRKEIVGANDKAVLDLKIYPEGYFQHFNPARRFTKWALVEVDALEHIPDGLALFHLSGGRYAVFAQRRASQSNRIFEYIFSEWLPGSEFVLDNRPHFDILSAGPKRNDPDAEEEIWIPIASKPKMP